MKIFWILMSILMMVVLFISSSIPGTESGEASMAIAEYIRDTFGISEETLGVLNFIVRKTAHFLAYFVLSFCVINSLKYFITNKKAMVITAWGIASLYGVIDEIHQYFVPGRVCALSDMLINSAGALVGVLLFLLLSSKKV